MDLELKPKNEVKSSGGILLWCSHQELSVLDTTQEIWRKLYKTQLPQ